MTPRQMVPVMIILLALRLLVSALPMQGAPAESDAMERADRCVADGKLEEAIAACTEAIREDSHLWLAFIDRATVYDDLFLPALAEEDFANAIRVNPLDYTLLNACGQARFSVKRYAEAIENFDAAIRLAPDRPAPYYSRGLAHLQLAHYEQAAADFTRLLDLDPNDALTWRGPIIRNRAIAQYDGGHFEQALADFELAEQNSQACAIDRGDCLVALKRWKEAERVFDEIAWSTDDNASAEQKNQRYEALCQHANLLGRQRYFARAEADLAEAIALQPDNSRAYGTAAWTRLFAGKLAEARAAAIKGLELDTTQDWIRTNLAHVYLLQDHFEWAWSVYHQAQLQDQTTQKQTQVQNILEDFATLREAGINHPDMARVEKLLHAPTMPTPSSAPTASPAFP